MNRIRSVMPRLGDGFTLAPHDHDPDPDLGAKIEQLTNLILLAQQKEKGELDMDDLTRSVATRLASQRGASKAASIGDGSAARTTPSEPHGGLKAYLGEGYEAGAFITAVHESRSRDASEQARGKASLASMLVEYRDAPELGKATLGTTGATGGYVLPNNVVDNVAKPAVQTISWDDLLTVRNGVAVRGVDQPFRTGAPTRLTPQDWGATKDNRNEAYGSYTASLVTFAAIFDVAAQYLRFSAGAAEQDVMDELNKAKRLAETYAVLAGPGTGTVGSGDATLGVYTSLNATPSWLGYKAAKTGSATTNTIAGSFAAACAEVIGILAGRSRFPSAILTDSTTYFAMIAQGSDTAGFWLSPQTSGGLIFDANGGLSFNGVPIKHDPNFNSFTGATKHLIAGDWKALKLYRGSEFRIDSSDQAGDRWDKNLVGFRGELELGVNAETAVHTGAFQLMTAVIA